ncbi:hypothetical protein NOK72_25030 [Vibrio parahaemolyticus]|uniref:glycosyltransferase n=1 Tax=Vibrio parahaemolyticus TaxID=670 RepID=UPI00226B85A7|nr:glycosyltransferase [Vibrio parahaemolyticus]MCX8824526.1 hypothetical protein [Vibrio parahaemolyticus]MCX8835043.1 hypothetical protein [Vibrio parahaemolyticus]HCG9120972.1 hypothetical protein [Vibrio parahaemolyticus]
MISYFKKIVLFVLSFIKLDVYKHTFKGRLVTREQHDSNSTQNYLNINKKSNLSPSLAAIYRIKNGSAYIEMSILSVCTLCKEIIVVDNGSDDNTLSIVKRLQNELKDICEIKIFSYDISPILAGEGYYDSVREEPERSLAKFYNYCFSLSSCDYLMKCDAHYVFTPNGLNSIQKKMNLGCDIIRYRGVEITGGYITHEPFIFKRELDHSFIDTEYYERLMLPSQSFLNYCKGFIVAPCYIHVKRLVFAKYIGSAVKPVKRLYK